MAILVDKNSKVIIQGITEDSGSYHSARMCDYGTNIVGGVAPGQGGQKVYDRPVFDTVEECVDYTSADTSVIFQPARFVRETAIEAIRAGIKLIVIIPGHIPIHDMLHIRKEAEKYAATVIGGNSPGIITPGQALVGIIPEVAFKPGRVGIVSRSGSIAFYAADTLTRAGYGETTCVGLGGDSVSGTAFSEILWKFEGDPETRAVVMIGEIGGVYEEMAADTVRGMKTPVLLLIGGLYAPLGKRMGHAGAIIEGGTGMAMKKLEVLVSAGAHPCRTFLDIPKTLEKLGI